MAWHISLASRQMSHALSACYRWYRWHAGNLRSGLMKGAWFLLPLWHCVSRTVSDIHKNRVSASIMLMPTLHSHGGRGLMCYNVIDPGRHDWWSMVPALAPRIISSRRHFGKRTSCKIPRQCAKCLTNQALCRLPRHFAKRLIFRHFAKRLVFRHFAKRLVSQAFCKTPSFRLFKKMSRHLANVQSVCTYI